jgi:hypothetical protein
VIEKQRLLKLLIEGLLSQEFTCENCGKTRNDLWFPYKLDGKTFCDSDCQEAYRKKNSKNENPRSPDYYEKVPGPRKPYEEEKEICEKCYKKFPSYEKRLGENLCAGCQRLKDNKELKDEVRRLREHLEKTLGKGEEKYTKNKFADKTTAVKKNPFSELIEWVRKWEITNICLDLNSNQLVIEFNNNNSKILENNELSPEQKELRNFFMVNPSKTSFSRSELEELSGNAKGQGDKHERGDNSKLIKGIVAAGVILMVVAIIGVAVYKSKKKNY